MSRADFAGYDGRIGDFVAYCVNNGSSVARQIGRIYGHTAKSYRVQMLRHRRRWRGAEYGFYEYEGVELRERAVKAELCICAPYFPGAQPHCSGCMKPLSLFGYPSDPVWVCNNKDCGAMMDWLSPLKLLLPQIKWAEVAA